MVGNQPSWYPLSQSPLLLCKIAFPSTLRWPFGVVNFGHDRSASVTFLGQECGEGIEIWEVLLYNWLRVGEETKGVGHPAVFWKALQYIYLNGELLSSEMLLGRAVQFSRWPWIFTGAWWSGLACLPLRSKPWVVFAGDANSSWDHHYNFYRETEQLAR